MRLNEITGSSLAVVASAVVAAVALNGCSGGSSPDASQDSMPSLSLESLCDDWSDASGGEQRGFAEAYAGNYGATVTGLLATVTAGCAGNKALTLQEAITNQQAIDEPTTDVVPVDPFSETRVDGATAQIIARSIRESWNECGERDVCIPGEHAYSVGCRQPDLQVRELSCFVTTEKGSKGRNYGYNVRVTVATDGSYSWGIDRR